MTDIIFTDKSREPTNADLRAVLGEKYMLWEAIRRSLEKKYGSVEFEWKYYGKKNGWLCKNLVNNRNLFFFVPGNKGFRLSFTFGEAAVKAINNSDFPKSVKESVDAGRKYAEGRVLQLEVNNERDRDTVFQLIDIKAAN